MKKRTPKTLGVMIDMSRNSVMTVEALKRYFNILKKFGYNCAMLYTEDTYEVDGEPYFGYLRGRYSKDELKEIDAYAASLGIELIPCIQTLAHLNAFIRWNKTPVDCADILLTDDEKTYELIDRMFSSLSDTIKSRRIHIGMDEAWSLGRGRHLNEHGYENANDIIKRHLARVYELAKKYGYEPMLWSDMFFLSWSGGYYSDAESVPEEIKDSFPKGVSPVYWNYYDTDENKYDNMLKLHSQLSKTTWFAGGSWCWSGFIPDNRHSLNTMIPAMRSCRKNGIENIIITLWGDDGGECSHFSQLPSLLYIAECAKGNEDEESIKLKFKRIVGMDFDDYMKIDLPNKISDKSIGTVNPSKYMLYSDTFLGFLDYTVAEGVGEIYREHAKVLSDISRKSTKYGYVFKTAAALCRTLSTKYELGVKVRAAYKSGDKELLGRLATVDYTETIRSAKEFYRAFKAQWFKDYKPHGFDIQDLRIGGTILRLESCKARLLDYLNGKISSIDELEETILPYGNKEAGIPIYCNQYSFNSSTNVS